MAVSKFTQKKYEVEYLEHMYKVLENDLEYINTTWGETGEVKQKTRWNSETREDELVFDDDGNPVMYNVRGNIPVKPEDLTEEDKCRIKIIKELMAKVEKMM